MTKQKQLLPLGPVMVDVQGLELTAEDRRRLLNPSVGAVILFARNYKSKTQVTSLIDTIKSLRNPSLLVAVDQEGGRVQRFKDEFTRLPAPQSFGDHWSEDKQAAPIAAYQSAYTMASELIDVGVDFSFAPVFDVTSRESEVIGDRCFHSDPRAATELLGAYIDGMHAAGMVAIAKHFPGHGGVSGDSHHCLPEDRRTIEQIREHDLKPYSQLVDEIQGVMTAHVLFNQCDAEIPTYSSYWLQDVLRQEVGFDGVVFSDDLTMQGAIDANGDHGSIVESAQRAIYAGCDMVLVCNRPDLADQLLEGLEFEPNEVLSAKLSRLAALKTPPLACQVG
ncbi:MAG: beta-N-acetylhexosaminidase [Arenicella sp.]|jgi:beta-N-acetylhexosaminidase